MMHVLMESGMRRRSRSTRWTVTSVIAPMVDMGTVYVLARLRIGAPRSAALFAARVAVVAAQQMDSGA